MANQSKSKKIAKRGRLPSKQEKQIHKVASGGSKKAAQRPEQSKISSSQKSSLLQRANDIVDQLDQLPLKKPHFMKVMLKSHVSGGFWLGLPTDFCRRHMGEKDRGITLEDEAGYEFETKYLGGKTGLSAGWRGFSEQHHLLEGYVLVFHKVQAHKFKVYIVKPDSPKQVKFAPDVSQSAVDTQMIASTTSSELSEDLLYIAGGHDQEGNTEGGDVSNYIEGFENNDDLGAGRSESDDASPFKEVTCFDKFKVMFHGQDISCQIPKDVLNKYYELCRSQNTHLHQNVEESLNTQLVVGMICETVKIADAIKLCKITTTKESEFLTWDNTLQASEMLGMNVGFMRTRVRRLASLAAESLQVAASFEKVTNNVPW